jgi:hypothetical protein
MRAIPVAFAMALVAAIGACAPAPIHRPIKGGPVDAGPGSLEAVRRQLQGHWTLESYDVIESGKRRTRAATGVLSYDEFGNLTRDGELREGQSAAARRPLLLNYSGRTAIDVTTGELRLLNVAAIGDAVSPDNVRHYDIPGSILTLSVVGPGGKVSAVSRWKKSAN